MTLATETPKVGTVGCMTTISKRYDVVHFNSWSETLFMFPCITLRTTWAEAASCLAFEDILANIAPSRTTYPTYLLVCFFSCNSRVSRAFALFYDLWATWCATDPCSLHYRGGPSPNTRSGSSFQAGLYERLCCLDRSRILLRRRRGSSISAVSLSKALMGPLGVSAIMERPFVRQDFG